MMAKAPAAKKTPTKKVAVQKAAAKKSSRQAKAAPKVAQAASAQAPQKNAFEEKFVQGTAFDLDYGKLLIIALCVYLGVQVSQSINIKTAHQFTLMGFVVLKDNKQQQVDTLVSFLKS